MTKHGLIRCIVQGGASVWRAETLLIKEPQALDWIDEFEEGDVFYDIGASTGPYVIYTAAAGRVSRILAFEPSPWNWWILAEQVRRAELGELIQAYPIAPTDESILTRRSEVGGSVQTGLRSRAFVETKPFVIPRIDHDHSFRIDHTCQLCIFCRARA